MTWAALLLADPSPSLRSLVLRELLGLPEDDPEVRELAALREDEPLIADLLADGSPAASIPRARMGQGWRKELLGDRLEEFLTGSVAMHMRWTDGRLEARLSTDGDNTSAADP